MHLPGVRRVFVGIAALGFVLAILATMPGLALALLPCGVLTTLLLCGRYVGEDLLERARVRRARHVPTRRILRARITAPRARIIPAGVHRCFALANRPPPPLLTA